MKKKSGATIAELIIALVIVSIALGAFFKGFLSTSASFKVRENVQVAQLVASSVSSVVASLKIEDFDCTLRGSGIHPTTGELILTPATDTWLSDWISYPVTNVNVKVFLRNPSTQAVVTGVPNLGAVYKQERVITAEVTYQRSAGSASTSTYSSVQVLPPLDRKNRLRQNSWRALRSSCYTPTNVPQSRGGIFSSIWTGERVIVFGGVSRPPLTYLNTGGVYNPKTDTWTPTSVAAGVPSPRNEHIAVWTGTEMIIWGGHDGMSYLSNGSRYNPTTNTWTPMSNLNSPEGRCCFVGAWTGSQLLVWGGGGGVNPRLGSIGVYDPSTDVWLNPAPADSALRVANSTGVWTGTELVVWGGNTFGSGHTSVTTNQGAAYNLATNSWRAIPTAGAPSAREDMVSSWTGSEMIIWGGSSNGGAAVSVGGARYNPVTNRWQPISIINEPIVQIALTANTQSAGVWSGQNLIIWGKRDDIVMPATAAGGWYNPQRNQWNLSFNPLLLPTDPWESLSNLSEMLTSALAPIPSQLSTGVWADGEMFVFGGFGGPSNNTSLDTYGAFAP